MEGQGTIEVFDAPHHLRVVSTRGGNWVRLAHDFYIEGKGGSAILRLVHSGFLSTADWDQEFNGTKAGWPVYFRILHHALTRHRGVAGRSLDLYALSSDPLDRTWALLAPLRPDRLGGENEPNLAWWTSPEQNEAILHLCCSPYGPKTGIWLNIATFGLPDSAVETIHTDWKRRLAAIFPEQTSGTCA